MNKLPETKSFLQEAVHNRTVSTSDRVNSETDKRKPLLLIHFQNAFPLYTQLLNVSRIQWWSFTGYIL